MDTAPEPQNTNGWDGQTDGIVVSQDPKKTSRLRSINRYQLLVAAVIFGSIGTYLIVGSHAATVSLAKVWKTTADWQTGTLQNVATSNNSLVLSSPLQTSTTNTTSGTDLALHKPTKASSIESSSYQASNAVDGNSKTRWSSKSRDPQWIYVDLGSNYNINEVKLNWETAYGKAYKIQVSQDASNWTTLYSTTTGKAGVNDLTGLKGSGRYVRMYGTVRGTQWGYSLWDMSVYGASTVPPPPAYASSGSITLSYDAGSSVDWNSLTSQASIPSGTNITYQARTSSDNSTWSAWSSDITKLQNSRYIQVQAMLTTSNTSITPVLNSLTLGYNATVAAPTVSLSASPNPIVAGQTTTLTWNSTNTSSCTASNGWSGTKSTSGSTVSPALNQTTTYAITCTGTGGSASDSVTVNVSTATGNTKSIYWGAWIDGDTYGNGRTDAPWDSTSWDLFESHAGKKVSIIHYGQPPMWEQAFAPNTASLVTNRGAIPLMDMGSGSVSLTSITNGTYDSSITAWANSVKAWGKPFFFRWNWEMNGTWYSWGSQAKQNPAAYVAAWKHMHDVVVSHGATNVTWVWCPNTVFPGSTPLDQLYPGDSYVDWTCVDTYNKGPLYGDSWQAFSPLTQPTYNQLLSVAPSKPIMIGETATNENGGSKANWITDVLQTQLPNNFPKVKAFVWFNWPIFENNVTSQWPIESSSSSQNAFRTGISSPYYSTNGYGNLPPLTKVQPLP
jgi:hypothetical protein